MEGCINKNMTNKDIEIVFELLEKYHIYQLNSGKYWKKLTYHSSSYFDGYEWSLYLVFERDKYLRIFNGNDYPDIFTHLAQEIIDLTGKDILNVNSMTITSENGKLFGLSVFYYESQQAGQVHGLVGTDDSSPYVRQIDMYALDMRITQIDAS